MINHALAPPACPGLIIASLSTCCQRPTVPKGPMAALLATAPSCKRCSWLRCLAWRENFAIICSYTWYIISLVGGRPTLLKNMSSSVGILFPNIWKNKTCSKPPPGGKEELLIINEMNPVNYNHVRIMSNSYHTKQIQTKNAPQETAQSHWNDQLSNAVPTTKSLSCSMATSLGHRDSAARVDSSAWSLRNMASICSHCNCCQWSKWLLASM